ncbi:MAG: hypothetical protein ACP5OZ_03530 [Candidatus Woesearchaeota archaeon]
MARINYERKEILCIEQKFEELRRFYEKVYQNNKDGHFHFSTAQDLIKFKEKNSEQRDFVEKNIYFLIGLERLKEIAGLEEKIVFLEKGNLREIEKNVQEEYNSTYYPVCYILDKNKKRLVVANYEKSFQQGGPEIIVLNEE